ncbi:MAG: UDP-3-O-acyl-N-acetylglucosamine deacetylase [Holosporaceae bacterium]|jgi:UDP-3-O-[3-hydroxymyristoyl] N-acetylglucosamine deacetylase|nr:UDP-3-O-acyl-N-acetylglucosamine deacetylase [Holosporaceae bacterium]
MQQATLNSVVFFEGIGTHSGKVNRISVAPSPENTFITFGNKENRAIAKIDNVRETEMCTKLLIQDDWSISTVEHILAAFYGLGITNALIEVEGDEIPTLDGSSVKFIESFLVAGIKEQSAKAKILRILKPVTINDGEKWASLLPSDSLIIDIKCDYTSKGLKSDPISFVFTKDDFIKEISSARTFGFFSDVEFLRKNGLALGASLDNTVVFNDVGLPINEEGLRFPNEPIRHKILDAIGDLSLAGCRIMAKFESFCPNHKMNNMVLKALFSDPNNYEIL